MMQPRGLALLESALGKGGVVAYHGVRDGSFLASTHITPERFGTHMEFLADSYTVLPLGEFVQRRREGKSVRGCVAVTFDDAYVGILHHALPILERRGVAATVFVATSFCRGRRFWWDRIEWAREKLGRVPQAGLLAGIGLDEDAAGHEVRDRLLIEFRGALPRTLDRRLSAIEGQEGKVPERAMTDEELRELGHSELIDFGCHTAHHYALPWLHPSKIDREIRLSHNWLRQRLPRVRPYLAYPYGLHSEDTIRAAKRCGMEAAFTISGWAATSRFPMYACSRVGMADVNKLDGLRTRLSWATIPVLALRDRRWLSERTP